MLSALLVLVAAQLQADCSTLDRVQHANGSAWVVRLCIRDVAPVARIPAGMLGDVYTEPYDFAAPVVEYGVVDAQGRDAWIIVHFLGMQPEPLLGRAPCNEGRLWRVFESARFALRRARSAVLRTCIVATTPRPVAWSKDGAFVALRWPGEPTFDPATMPRPIDIVDASDGSIVMSVARVVDIDRARVAVPWPRGCLPLTFDELHAEPYPMLCLGAGDANDELVADVELATRTLLRTHVTPRRAARTTRDPFTHGRHDP
jgi:hypothetical protein